MRPIKRAIVLCWIMLVACFVIKLFGGNWFEVVCTNEHFSNFCNLIENSKPLYVILSFFVYVIPTILIILPICETPIPKKSKFGIVFNIVVCLWAISFINDIVKIVAEIVVIFCLPVVINFFDDYMSSFSDIFKKYWWKGIVGYLTILSFQIISLITKNIGVKMLNENLVTTFILLIDYYIMSILFYLYSIKKKGRY